MGAAYGTRLGSRLIGRLFGLPDDESMEAFVTTALATDRSAIKAISNEAASKPLPDGLDQVATPTLAVVGERDTKPAKRTFPLLATTMPDARGAEVPGVGHQWNAEEPTLFSDMVRLWVLEQSLHPSLTEVPGPATA
jgi:pimeloyl-ACP methyl ester carboxylesterase